MRISKHPDTWNIRYTTDDIRYLTRDIVRHCTVYNVLYTVPCSLHDIQSTKYNVYYYVVHCTPASVRRTLYSVHYIKYNVDVCTTYIVRVNVFRDRI